MRIISKFYDYYDKAAGFEVDPKLVYVRDMIEDDFEYWDKSPKWAHNLFGLVNAIGYRYSAPHGVIAFCGKMYPYYQLADIRWTNKKFYYSAKRLHEVVNSESFEKMVIDSAMASYKANEIARARAESKEYLEKIRKEIENLDKYSWYNKLEKLDSYCGKNVDDKVFIEAGTPIIRVYKGARGYSKGAWRIVRNPRLSEFNFISIIDPVTAWQEIAMFLGNNMAKQIDPTVNFTDDMKRDIAGFDKWSFRKQGKIKK